MFDLKQSLNAISSKWKYKLDEINPGVYRMDVELKVSEDNFRYQFVYIWQIEDRFFGEPAVFMNSRCGEYSSSVDLHSILDESSFCNLSSFALNKDKRADGSSCEVLVCQSALPVETISEALLDKAIYEVAFNADMAEEKYFGGDGN